MKKRIKFLGLISLALLIITCSKEGEGEETGTDNNGPPTEETKGKEFDVNVSGSAATITIPDAIMITVPQGAFEGKATFKVATLQSSDLPKAEDFTIYEAFEVTSTSGSTFNKELEITIKYDASQGEKEAGRNGAAYYDEKRKRWIPFTDVTVDEEKSEIKFKSNHLCKLSRYSIKRQLGYTDWRSSLHFYIYWNAAKVPDNTTYISPYKTVNVGTDPHYVQDIERYLEDAYAVFKNAQLQLPNGKIDVYLKNLGSGIDGMTSFMGSIYINEAIQNSNYATVEEALPMVCAHELLHYIQDYYYVQLFSDFTTKWWLETTAVQADRFVWPTNKKFEVLEYAQNLYQNLPRSWDDCNSDPEYYIAGNFLAYLITYRQGEKLTLPDLIKECGKASNISSIRTIIDNLLRTKKTTIGQEYTHFIQWAIEGKSDIKLPPMSPTPTPVYPNFKNAILTDKTQQGNLNADIPYLATCFFKGMNKTKEKLTLIAKMESKSDYITALAYKMSKNANPVLLREMNSKDSVELESASDSLWIDVVCINKDKDQKGSAAVNFHFITTQPKITSILPNKVKPGDTITITGVNLVKKYDDVYLYVNDQLVNMYKVVGALVTKSDTKLVLVIPEDIQHGIYNIHVTTNGIPSNKVSIEVEREKPVIQLWGCKHYILYPEDFILKTWGFPMPDPEGMNENPFIEQKIYLAGKNWVNDYQKTIIKINGTPLPLDRVWTGAEPFHFPTYQRELAFVMPTDISGNITITIETVGVESNSVNFFVGVPITVLQKELPFLGVTMSSLSFYYNDALTKYITIKGLNGLESGSNENQSVSWRENVLTVICNKGGVRYEFVYIFSEDGMKASLQGKINSDEIDFDFTVQNLYVEIRNGLKYIQGHTTQEIYSFSGTVKTAEGTYPITKVSYGLIPSIRFRFPN